MTVACSRAARLSPLSSLAQLRDHAGISDAFTRIDLLFDEDPGGVVGAVKELLEATAKTVLEHLGQPVDTNEDLPSLITRTQNALGLGVATVDDSLDTAASVKKILGSLKGLALGITQLRNSEGSGHGRVRGSKLTPRHARLALNAGRTWCEIVLDTYGDTTAPWRNRSPAV